ncbi:hypothetical protein BB561_006233, partial [Smittium simulii]
GAQQAQDMKVQKIECDNPHEKVRAPMVEEPNTREKNKGNYLRIPKFLEMKYTLPPLNEAATSALMELPDRVPQLVESTVKPLVKNKKLEALLVAINPTKRIRKNKRSPFFSRQQTAFIITSTPAHTSQNITPNTANNLQTPQSSKTTRYVLSRMGQTHRQQVGQKHSRKGTQHSAQESESRETKGFNKETLYKFQRNK